MVKLGFTENKVTVQESEGEVELCVSISHTIARPLNFIIVHNFIVAGDYDTYLSSIQLLILVMWWSRLAYVRKV